jgi:hypothetical protein
MCKEIWIKAVDNLEEKLNRDPTTDEVEVEYQSLCSAMIERQKND